jgi:hypothetical protein
MDRLILLRVLEIATEDCVLQTLALRIVALFAARYEDGYAQTIIEELITDEKLLKLKQVMSTPLLDKRNQIIQTLGNIASINVQFRTKILDPGTSEEKGFLDFLGEKFTERKSEELTSFKLFLFVCTNAIDCIFNMDPLLPYEEMVKVLPIWTFSLVFKNDRELVESTLFGLEAFLSLENEVGGEDALNIMLEDNFYTTFFQSTLREISNYYLQPEISQNSDPPFSLSFLRQFLLVIGKLYSGEPYQTEITNTLFPTMIPLIHKLLITSKDVEILCIVIWMISSFFTENITSRSSIELMKLNVLSILIRFLYKSMIFDLGFTLTEDNDDIRSEIYYCLESFLPEDDQETAFSQGELLSNAAAIISPQIIEREMEEENETNIQPMEVEENYLESTEQLPMQVSNLNTIPLQGEHPTNQSRRRRKILPDRVYLSYFFTKILKTLEDLSTADAIHNDQSIHFQMIYDDFLSTLIQCNFL